MSSRLRGWGALATVLAGMSLVFPPVAATGAPKSFTHENASLDAANPETLPPDAEAEPAAAGANGVEFSGPQNAKEPALVLGTRLGEHPDRTRFVVELSDPVQVRVFTLTDPYRVVMDMPEVLWRMPDVVRPSGKGAVKSYRYGLFRKGNSRFVIDLNKPVRVGEPRIYPPQGALGFRLVLDLYPTTSEAFLASSGWPGDRALGSATPQAAALAALPAKRVIVIDAGHGGVDPGARGAGGLTERDVVLAVARTLRDALEATGHYTVQLTRDNDVYIPLRERVQIARAAHGDLFLSLHADANDHRDISGASIYTLSEEASDREAAILAEKENMSDVIAGVNLAGENSPVASILIDLAQRDTLNRSARFAQTALENLGAATALQHKSPHRSAGFAVLKAPDVPAVLVELGYLSNPEDEAKMTSDAWRLRVAAALVTAINKHFARETPLAPRAAAIQ